MGLIYKNGVAYGGSTNNASLINYNNTDSGLSSTNLQDAVDEINEKIGSSDISGIGNGTISDAINKLNSNVPEVIDTYENIRITLPATAAATAVLEYTVEKAGIYQAQTNVYGHADTEARLLAAVTVAGHLAQTEITRSGYYGINAILTWECAVGDVIKCSYYCSVAQSVANHNISATIIRLR